MLALLPLWRYRTTGKQSRLAATGVYAPSLRSPWRAAKAKGCLFRLAFNLRTAQFFLPSTTFEACYPKIDCVLLFSNIVVRQH